MAEFEVSFRSGHAPVKVGADTPLSDRLTAANSPVLFGCRTGICGTCASRVEVVGAGKLEPIGGEEAETLRLFCPGQPQARLLCQIRLTADVRVEPLSP